jgi:uncharacterized lipoprotein YbaY
MMRTITGAIVLPGDAPVVIAGQVIIEVLDISLADAPSQLIAEQLLSNVALQPGGRINFSIVAPEVDANRTLTLRVHISLDGSGQVKSGDLLSTTIYPIPNTGTPPPFDVAVVVI